MAARFTWLYLAEPTAKGASSKLSIMPVRATNTSLPSTPRRRGFHRLGAAGVWVSALALAGCASLLPDARRHDTTVELPPAWSSAGDSALSDAVDHREWWRRFNDPSLTALIERALQANTDVGGAVAALRQARALLDVQNAGLSPQVSGSASAQRSRSNGLPASNLFRIGLDASWEPDLFGAQRAGISAAHADVVAGVATLGDVQVSIAAETALAYLQWCGTRERLGVARRNLDTQLETLQITEWRTQAGLATSLELEQARTAAEQTRAQIPLLDSTLAQAASSLAVLTGRAPGVLPELQASTATQAPAAPLRIALRIPADTLRQRPDVRRTEAQWRAAAARTQQAEAQRLPSLRLTGDIGLNALTIGALGGAGSGVAALLAGVSVPILDGGALRAKAEAQDAGWEQAARAAQGTVLAALKDVEDALRALQSAQERRTTLQRAAESAGNAALLASQRYRSGLVDFQIVLDTQRSLLSTQDSLASAQTDVGTAQVRLFKALGGGWTLDESAAMTTTPTP